jgi:hypothetical protein
MEVFGRYELVFAMKLLIFASNPGQFGQYSGTKRAFGNQVATVFRVIE